jgi:hypothetical protein
VIASALLAACIGSAAAEREQKPATPSGRSVRAGPAAEHKAGTQPPPAVAPSSEGGDAFKVGPRTRDPFAGLRVKIPPDQLPPLKSVRIRDQRERPQGKITVTIKTMPEGAKVTYGRKNLGLTPIKLQAEANSTPLDIVVRKAGYMVLRTRIQRP